MRICKPLVWAGSGLLALTGCSPTFNWRDVRLEAAPVTLLMPCKPEKAQKTVPLGGAPTELRMLSCDAGNATFAVVVGDVTDPGQAAAALVQWQAATLANIRGAGVAQVAFKLPGATVGALMVKATGRRADGQPVNSQALYFAKGSQVFQAVMYADKVSPDVAETFFSGLKFE